jgi:NhaC family Na+:H+ antiporter
MIYLILSFFYGLGKTDTQMLSEISANYDIGIVTAIPALVIVILSLLRYNVFVSMSVSVLSGVLVAVYVQEVGILQLLNYLLTGYELESSGQFAEIISGGGILSMVSTMCILLISSGYSGIFEETGVLKDVISFLESCSRKIALYPLTLITAFFTAAFGCTQTLSIILTNQLMSGIYSKKGLDNSSLALDIEDSSVVVSPLIPWNIAVAVPMVILSVGANCIPYAVFLYVLPLYRIFVDFPKRRRSLN